MTTTDRSPCTFGLIRHGETRWNREKRIQGHTNSALTPGGRATVAGWAPFLAEQGWGHILASDLGRARETVEILNVTLQLPVAFDARLREQHWGDWEGLTLDALLREHGAELDELALKGWDFRPPNGESRREVHNRALAALDDFRQAGICGRTLVVCHLGVIKCLLYGVAGCTFLPGENIAVEKRCLHHLCHDGDGYSLGPINIALPGEKR